MDLRKALLESRTKVKKVLERQIGVQSADDVELGNGLVIAGSGSLESLFEGHGVGAGRIFLSPESAHAAGSDAHIRRIDVAIDSEIRHVAVHALAHFVGQPTDGENVAR